MNNETAPAFKGSETGQGAMPYRHQILQKLLENKNGLGIDSIAAQMPISRTAVQQHFLVLEKEGLIKKHDQIKTNGRPITRYVLTDAGINYFPKHYLEVSSLLIQNLKEELGSEQLTAYLQKLGVKQAQSYHAQFAGKSDRERVTLMAELLEKMGFNASLHEDSQTGELEIRAYNCIYHELARQFQEVCAFDLALVGELLGQINNQSPFLHGCMAKGDGFCCIKIKG